MRAIQAVEPQSDRSVELGRTLLPRMGGRGTVEKVAFGIPDNEWVQHEHLRAEAEKLGDPLGMAISPEYLRHRLQPGNIGGGAGKEDWRQTTASSTKQFVYVWVEGLSPCSLPKS